jgi:hypothetical protein
MHHGLVAFVRRTRPLIEGSPQERLAAGRAARSDMGVIGQTLGGRYRLMRPIGEGGMGVVYEAEQLDLRRRVALKVLHEADPRSVDRFMQEALATANLASPNVVTVLDFMDVRPPCRCVEATDTGVLDAGHSRPGQRILSNAALRDRRCLVAVETRLCSVAMTVRRRAALVAVFALAACKAKHQPEPEPVPSVEPMPVAPPIGTTPPAAPFPTTTGETKPGTPIRVAAFTTPATTGLGARGPMELRSNGTILFSGKEYAKFDGDKIVDLTGSTIVRVAPDGSLEGDVDPSGQRFIGDELQRNADVKLSVGKDGNLTSTVSGKKTVIAKVNGVNPRSER